ncbi:MAG TPA: efflux RND transporter periplasmic adaptor subunit [Thermoanaerobaculia bacterium]|nr:efflux RND transporter periplasmic adaptor subunit [Thermoanaerobaculia bacterium]
MRRRTDVLAALAAVALLFACKKKEKEAPVRASVTTVRAAPGTVAQTLELSGRLVPPPSEDATLAPQVAGRLLSVSVREGDRVKQGDVLATLDPAPLEEAERAAEAALAKERADAAAKRRVADLTAKLFEKGIASAEERDKDRAESEAARSAEVEAETHLLDARRKREWTRVAAPFSGVVAQVMKHAGETVDGTPATAVLRLLGSSAAEVAAEAAAADLARVKEGAAASVPVPGGAARGTVVRVPAAVDAATGLGEIRVRLEGPAPAPLLSNVTLRVVLVKKDGVLVVPARAVRRAEDGTDEVVRVVNGAAHPVRVTLGLRSADAVEIAAGLSPGDVVVLDSPLGLAEGAPLEVKNPGPG